MMSSVNVDSHVLIEEILTNHVLSEETLEKLCGMVSTLLEFPALISDLDNNDIQVLLNILNDYCKPGANDINIYQI